MKRMGVFLGITIFDCFQTADYGCVSIANQGLPSHGGAWYFWFSQRSTVYSLTILWVSHDHIP